MFGTLETKGEKLKWEIKGLHWGILKTKVQHKEICAHSLRETMHKVYTGNCAGRAGRKTKIMLPKDTFLRMCIGSEQKL